MPLAVVLAEVKAALDLGRFPNEWYTLLSRSCTSTNKALSSNFFSSYSRVDPNFNACSYWATNSSNILYRIIQDESTLIVVSCD